MQPVNDRKITCIASLLLTMSLPVLVSCETGGAATAPRWSGDERQVGRTAPPLLLRPLTRLAAIAINSKIPFSTEPLYIPTSFTAPAEPSVRARAVQCLAQAIYYEASGEQLPGQQAVAQVVLNRVRNAAFPSTVCGVVYEGSNLATGCQFSFTCDGSLQHSRSEREWDRSLEVADAALSGFVYAPVGLSTHYHSDQVVPYWATSLAKTVQIGGHIFYKWPNNAGSPASFHQVYLGRERDPAVLETAALISHRLWPARENMPASPVLNLSHETALDLEALLQPISGYTSRTRPAEPAQLAIAVASSPVVGPEADPQQTLTEQDQASPATVGASIEGTRDKLRLGPPPPDDLVLLAHPGIYRRLRETVQRRALAAAADWQTYTGNAVEPHAPVRPKAAINQGFCSHGSTPGTPAKLVPHSATHTAGDIFVKAGLAEGALRVPAGHLGNGGAKEAAVLDNFREQIALAVFARVAALSQGDVHGRLLVRNDVANGFALVPLFERRLTQFERRRDEFQTLNDFLPLLLAGLLPDADQGQLPTSVEATCEDGVLASSAI